MAKSFAEQQHVKIDKECHFTNCYRLKNNPPNRRVAFAFGIHGSCESLLQMAQLPDEQSYRQQIKQIRMLLDAAEEASYNDPPLNSAVTKSG